MIMDTSALYESIFHRKSVRRYASEALSQDMQRQILALADAAECPKPDAKLAFRILPERQVKGMISAKAPHYLAVYADADPGSLVSAAFKLQQIDLWLSSQGIGCCWLGMARAADDAREADGLPLAVMLSFGKPKEPPHRSSVDEFNRKPLTGMTDLLDQGALLEPVRLAPSASNRQPWYVSEGDQHVRLFLKQTNPLMKKMLGDMPLLDMGIALCHLWLSMLHQDSFGGFALEANPASFTPRGCDYVWSIRHSGCST